MAIGTRAFNTKRVVIMLGAATILYLLHWMIAPQADCSLIPIENGACLSPLQLLVYTF